MTIDITLLGEETQEQILEGMRIPVKENSTYIAMVVPIEQYKAMLRLEQEHVHRVATKARMLEQCTDSTWKDSIPEE